MKDYASLIEVIGWIGACGILLAYFLLSAKKLSSDSYTYQGMNISAAALIAIYTFCKGAIASVFVNIVWIMIGFYAVYSIRKRKHI